MIVRRGGGALHLITQPDHAALAGRIMEHWAPLQHAERRASILLAIREHDNGWREPDSAPTIDQATGRVNDFINAPAAIRQAVWPRGVSRLSHDPWAAALVAQHALTVYERHRDDGAWAGFFAGMTRQRDALLATTTRTFDDLARDYAFVRIGDLISLIFCNLWTDEQTYHDWIFTLEGSRVVVTPDAFSGREIPLEVGAVELPNRSFASDAELRHAIAGAPRVNLFGACCGRTSA